MKNPHSSLPGTDLVGFHHVETNPCFAFAEVKTSQEKVWPPSVVKGRHGLVKQIENLRDIKEIKHDIVRYLTYRAKNAKWYGIYQKAAQRYLSDPTDISLFGILIRDVEPKQEDIQNRAKTLAKDCPRRTVIELHALYIPEGSMEMFVNHVRSQRGN